MNNKVPKFSTQEWDMMQDYINNSSKEPRQNLIELISHVDPATAQLGMNSGPYFVFDRLLSDEQISVALHLKLRVPEYIDVLAKKAGRSVEDTARLADEMVKIGLLVYKPDERGVDRVELPIFVVGSLEHTINGGLKYNQYEHHPELAVGFIYHTTQMATQQGFYLPPANFGVHRPVPIGTALKNETRVESWENLEKLIEESSKNSFALAECICRKIRKQYGQMGEEPDINWCCLMGDFADSAIRAGKAVRITREEFMDRLREADKRGFVHNVSNHDGPSPIEYICNCDYETCLSIRASSYTGATNMQKSNFVATVDAEKCVACGSCVEKCPGNALKLGRKLPECKVTELKNAPFPPEENAMFWSKKHYNPEYLYNRKTVQPETGTAPCKVNCPAHIAVQGYLKMAAQGRYNDALELIKKENPLPAVCGSICNRRCEQVCTRGDVDQAVSIDEVKKFVAYRELNSTDRFVPEKIRDNGHKLAVIGGGPAGISAAYYLAIEGHSVTVFDKNKEPGGMLRYGIPSFRLEKDVLAAEIQVLKELGVKFECGVEIGENVTLQQLREQGYKGFVLAIGAQKSAKLHIPGEDLSGVHSSVDYLHKINEGFAVDLGKKVAVLGGGNVALDVARTAIRCGAEQVTIIYRRTEAEMPADKAELEEAIDEGISFKFLRAPIEICGVDGKVAGLKLEIMKLGEPDEKGHRKPEGTGEYELFDISGIISAIGQVVDWAKLDTGALVKTSTGLAVADSFTYQSGENDIFVAGDVLTGTKFAIDAIAAGKQAALSLHRFAWGSDLKTGRNLRDYKSLDKDNVADFSYDTANRQKPRVDISKRKTMHDARTVLSEEQIRIETSRCLGCGAVHVDENMCLGCGVCTTRCKMDAITLKKKYNCVPVPNEELYPSVGKECYRRRDALLGKEVIVKAIMTKVIDSKLEAPKLKNAKPRKW